MKGSTIGIFLAFLLLPPVEMELLADLPLLGRGPDLLLVVTIAAALYAHADRAVVIAWTAGFLADLLGGARPGVHALAFTLAAMVLIRIRREIFRDHLLTRIAVVGLTATAVHVTIGLALRLDTGIVRVGFVLEQSAAIAAWTVLAALPMLALADRFRGTR